MDAILAKPDPPLDTLSQFAWCWLKPPDDAELATSFPSTPSTIHHAQLAAHPQPVLYSNWEHKLVFEVVIVQTMLKMDSFSNQNGSWCCN